MSYFAPRRNRDEAAQAFIDGRSCMGGGTVTTDGRTIWSYGAHFPMATCLPSSDDVWVNSAKYSNTTSAHQGALKRALTRNGYRPTEETATFERFDGVIWSRGGDL